MRATIRAADAVLTVSQKDGIKCISDLDILQKLQVDTLSVSDANAASLKECRKDKAAVEEQST